MILDCVDFNGTIIKYRGGGTMGLTILNTHIYSIEIKELDLDLRTAFSDRKNFKIWIAT